MKDECKVWFNGRGPFEAPLIGHPDDDGVLYSAVTDAFDDFLDSGFDEDEGNPSSYSGEILLPDTDAAGSRRAKKVGFNYFPHESYGNDFELTNVG